MKKILFSVLIALSFISCANKTEKEETTVKENATMTDCDLTFGKIHFTKALNGADKLVTDSDGVLKFTANPKSDFFIDPNDGSFTETSAAVLLSEVDNSKPFAFTAKVGADFAKSVVYDGAVLFVYANDTLWQKLCFEHDERGKHRVISVRTVGKSDDNNHDVIPDEAQSIYFKISSDTRTVASYYSLDGQDWLMIRCNENVYPSKLYLGICSQAPQSESFLTTFSEMNITTDNVAGFEWEKNDKK